MAGAVFAAAFAGCQTPVPSSAALSELAPFLREPSLSEGRFTEIVASAVRHRLPDAVVVEKGRLELSITLGASEATTFLDNLWFSIQPDRSVAEARLEDFLGLLEETLGSAGSTDELRASAIVPVVVAESYLGSLAEQGGEGFHVAAEPLAGDLWIVYAEDTEKGTRYLDWKMVEGAGVSRADVRSTAVANLIRLLPDVERQGPGPAYRLAAGGSYEASLLLLEELWEEESSEVVGDVVVAVPARDRLLLTGSNSPEGVAILRKAASEGSEGPYSISTTLLVRRGGAWAVF